MEEKVSSDSFNSTKNNKSTVVPVVILTAFVVINIISNVIASIKLPIPIGFFGVNVIPAASILYAFVLTIDDINTNCLGYQSAKKATWISLISNIFMILIFWLVSLWPGVKETYPEVMEFLLGTFWVILGSIVAFFCSSFTNSYILQRIKRHQVDKGISTDNKWHLIIRTYGSSIPAQIIDSFMFVAIAFGIPSLFGAEPMPFIVILAIALNQSVCKLLVEAIIQPFLTKIIPWFSKKTGYDVVDREGFNPFKLS